MTRFSVRFVRCVLNLGDESINALISNGVVLHLIVPSWANEPLIRILRVGTFHAPYPGVGCLQPLGHVSGDGTSVSAKSSTVKHPDGRPGGVCPAI